MCISSKPIGLGGNCHCTSDCGTEAQSKEDLLTNLKEYKKKLKAELIRLDSKLKAADGAGKGGE